MNCADRSTDRKTGQKSPSYLVHPEAPARIQDWNLDVDLIFSLRHPVDRAYAVYCMHLQNPCESGVESENQHCSSEPTEHVYKKSLVGAHLRGLLNSRFLVDPAEERLDWLSHPAYGL